MERDETKRAGGVGASESKLSLAAVVGLILALVPCCPFTGLLGSFLGLSALIRIRHGGGRVRGGGVAKVAIVVGLVSALVWSVFGQWLLDHQDAEHARIMEDQIERVFRVGVSDEHGVTIDEHAAGEIGSFWTLASVPDAESVEAFAGEARRRYGAFERVAVISSSRSGSVFSPVIEIAGVMHFDRGTPLGSARFETRIVPGQWFAQLRLASLKIEDATLGDLVLGENVPPAVSETE